MEIRGEIREVVWLVMWGGVGWVMVIVGVMWLRCLFVERRLC